MIDIWQIDREAAGKFIDPSDGDFDELAGLFAKHREAAMKAMREAIEKKLDECGEPCPQCRDNVAAIQIKEPSNG